jgi:hypothetical protein
MGKTYLIAMAALLSGCLTAQTSDKSYIISANAMLKDGSSVKGEFCTERVTGSTIFAEKLDLDPAVVKSLAFTGTNGETKVELKNGDKFAMTVANESFEIKSLLGDLNIPRANFRALLLSARKVTTGGSNEGLVFYCTFDDEAAVRSPMVGPCGVFLQGKFNDGKVGNALLTTVYAQNATFDLPAEFFGTSGCIEFWAKILNPSPYVGNGGDPRLFTITQKSTKNTICTLDIVSNNGAGNSGFATWTFLGNMASIRGMRHLRYEELFPGSDYRDWHHYAVIWDANGIANLSGNPKKALLIDGNYIPDLQDHKQDIEAAQAIISTPMLLSFTHDPALDPERSTKSPFLIDEFKIWNYAKTDFDL